jgi:hypothetical protein
MRAQHGLARGAVLEPGTCAGDQESCALGRPCGEGKHLVQTLVREGLERGPGVEKLVLTLVRSMSRAVRIST